MTIPTREEIASAAIDEFPGRNDRSGNLVVLADCRDALIDARLELAIVKADYDKLNSIVSGKCGTCGIDLNRLTDLNLELARLKAQQADLLTRMDCGHLKADWVERIVNLPSQMSVAALEAGAVGEDHGHCSSCESQRKAVAGARNGLGKKGAE